MNDTNLVLGGKEFSSRLIVGTGKYSSMEIMKEAHEASGAEIITVAVRRVNISDRSKESLLDYIDTSKYFLLPNTAGCYTAEEAVRMTEHPDDKTSLLRVWRDGGSRWVVVDENKAG